MSETAPTLPAIPPEVLAKLKKWSEKLGVPLNDMISRYNKIKAQFQTSVPGRTSEWYANTARHRLYLTIKSELRSPAKPVDWISLGMSGAMDVTRAEREAKIALWNNPETRAQAVAEGQVLSTPTTFGNKTYPEGTPLDTREWMQPPDPATGFPGRKNRDYGKPLLPRFIRTLVGFGHPMSGGDFKLVSIMCNADSPEKLPVPPIGKGFRTRLNLRADNPYRYDFNWSTRAKFDPIVIERFEPLNTQKILEILRTAPSSIRSNLAGLMAWHKANEKDKRRLVIVEADVTWINRDPTRFGSYMMILEDASQEDLEAEGTPCWVPLELKGILDTFGAQSRVFIIGRTNIGPGFDRDTRQPLPDVERIQLNACGIFVVPEFRVPPEEETVLTAETVQ